MKLIRIRRIKSTKVVFYVSLFKVFLPFFFSPIIFFEDFADLNPNFLCKLLIYLFEVKMILFFFVRRAKPEGNN